MKVIPIVAAHYCDYFGVFLVVRLPEISRNLAKSNKSLLRKFAKSLCLDVEKFQTCGNYK